MAVKVSAVDFLVEKQVALLVVNNVSGKFVIYTFRVKFEPKEVGYIFLRNAGNHLLDYKIRKSAHDKRNSFSVFVSFLFPFPFLKRFYLSGLFVSSYNNHSGISAIYEQ
jgi:hypothetical protein